MPRILVTPAVYQDGRGPWRDVLDAAKFDVVIPPSDAVAMDAHTLIKHLAGIDGVLASVEHYTRHVLEASKLRAIARVGVGYDSIDVAAATERGVAIAITPGTNHHSVPCRAPLHQPRMLHRLPLRFRFHRQRFRPQRL